MSGTIDELLMIPGPTDISGEVLKEMSSKTVAHYGEDWTEYYNETRSLIKNILHTDNDLFLFVGSGHAAIDASLGSLLEEGDEVLVLSNGIFGNKLARISRLHKAEVTVLEKEWGKAFNPGRVDNFLKESQKDFKAMLMVDVETSTGIRNPVRELAEVAQKHDLISFVDGVCSIGVEEFYMDEWNIDFCVTASQKGLGAPPGLAIVCLNDRIWQAIDDRNSEIRGWYLNLKIMKEFEEKQKGWQPYGITMAVHNVMALKKALELIEKEGLKNRIKRHRESAEFFRKSIRELGLEVLAEEKHACSAVTAVKNPEGFDSSFIIDRLQENNIRIGNGLGEFAGDYIRVGHMNQGAARVSLYPVISVLEEILEKRKKSKNGIV
ncbi:pyridoxal-phosphate-dependent aminotransferase family protein [Halarsenatibacter silvermanii]|uniref:Aspartate aminotransferase n=1 Tax=Halarsenatibacter silvermanii TaxID=321763 RepID=A0A1G9SF83_9FIRM|nr:alanine--glyoxylate aminotransferase family protein [Halarsenatibacter silvermanii]SDM33957.1 aspartate aminotransferase [Halarsenatibacter silvermanii]